MVKGTLEVFLKFGKDIKDREVITDWLCGLNPWNTDKLLPYVVIQCGRHELTSDVADKEGKKLIWNEKLVLNLEYLEGEVEEYEKLAIKLMDNHKFSHDSFVGEATIYIKDVLSLAKEKGEAELGIHKYRVVLADKTYYGEISVGVSFILD